MNVEPTMPLQTLKQLLKDNQLPVIEIQDYPAIRYRGVVEGFYGTPWSIMPVFANFNFMVKTK